MDSIGNQVGTQAVVAEHFAENSRITMIQWTHGIKGVRGMASASLYGGLRGGQLGVGVTNADTHLAPGRFGDHFDGSRNFGRDGHHPYMAASRLPETLEDFNCGIDQIFRRMDTSPLVAEEGALEMNSQRPSG